MTTKKIAFISKQDAQIRQLVQTVISNPNFAAFSFHRPDRAAECIAQHDMDVFVLVLEELTARHVDFIDSIQVYLKSRPIIILARQIDRAVAQEIYRRPRTYILNRDFEIPNFIGCLNRILGGQKVISRHASRHRPPPEVKAILSTLYRRGAAEIEDLSLTGARIRVGGNPFRVGELLTLEVELPALAVVRKVVAKVM
ncbi:MAG: PilZ domain-containing protein, partial [Bdellovibrionales bacterium]|nr:PilZ domain-containing protein [Bdellovibrionales bacterium]